MSTPGQIPSDSREDAKLCMDGPGDVCRLHQPLLEIGMKKFNKSYRFHHDRFVGHRWKESSHLPRRLRHELVGRLKDDILPSLHDKLDSIRRLTNSDREDFWFEFQPALKLVMEIDELASRLISSLTWIRSHLVYRSCFEDFLQASGHHIMPESEPVEEVSHLPWKNLIETLEDLIMMLANHFLTPQDHLFDLHPLRISNSSRYWFLNLKDIQRHVACSITQLGRSDHEFYTDKWCVVVRIVENCLKDVNRDVFQNSRSVYHAGAFVTRAPDLSVLKATIPIVKLTRLFLNKFCKYTQNDRGLIRRIAPAQLEGLLRQIGPKDIRVPNFALRLYHFVADVIIGPRLDPDTLIAPRDAFLNHVEDTFKIFLRMLHEILDDLPSGSDSDQRSVENFRAAYKNWTDAYNLAVKQFLTNYKNIYYHEFHLRFPDDETYYGEDIGY